MREESLDMRAWHDHREPPAVFWVPGRTMPVPERPFAADSWNLEMPEQVGEVLHLAGMTKDADGVAEESGELGLAVYEVEELGRDGSGDLAKITGYVAVDVPDLGTEYALETDVSETMRCLDAFEQARPELRPEDVEAVERSVRQASRGQVATPGAAEVVASVHGRMPGQVDGAKARRDGAGRMARHD